MSIKSNETKCFVNSLLTKKNNILKKYTLVFFMNETATYTKFVKNECQTGAFQLYPMGFNIVFNYYTGSFFKHAHPIFIHK